MNKTYQRMILIVAVLICGLAYGLQSWQKSRSVPAAIDSTLRTQRLVVQDQAVQTMLQSSEKPWLMTLRRSADDSISHVLDSVMGGLGNKVLPMQLVLDESTGRTEWLQSYDAQYPKILQLYPPEAEIPMIVQLLRACLEDCQNRSEFLYLLDPKDLSVRYYGDQHWSLLELVQDIQQGLRK